MFKIEPFKHPLKLDPNYAENTWRLLELAIKEINNQNASGLSFEELYRCRPGRWSSEKPPPHGPQDCPNPHLHLQECLQHGGKQGW